MKTTRRQSDNVAITLRVMSRTSRRLSIGDRVENCLPVRLVTRERDGYVSRTGATLTEVLMSLMIMSIGVVSVATLFPISTLRTLEANKQTNSTIARFNAEALIDVDPQFVHNADGVWPPPPLGPGSDLTPYNSAISQPLPSTPPIQISTFRGQNYLVDPAGYQELNYDITSPTTPLAPFPLAPAIPAPPAAPPAVQSFRDYFGNNYPAVVNWPLPRRYTGASLFTIPYPTTVPNWDLAKARAAELVTQPDNWKLVTESQITATTTSVVAGVTGITGVTADLDADLSSINLASTGVMYRVVIYDIDGTRSETRTIHNINAATLTLDWVPAAPAAPQLLPAHFNTSVTGASPNVGKVRIEQSDQIYTWMLSVRKRPSGQANVDVVVFFKRNFDPNHERVFDAEFRKWNVGPDGVPGRVGDDNGAGGAEDINELGYPGSDDVRNAIVTLKWPSVAPDEERPHPRRGGYIYDTKNGLWYRIRAVQNEQFGMTGVSGLEDWVDVVLDETIKLDSTEDLNGNGTLDAGLGEDLNGNGAKDQGGAIVLPSVANVFPLEIKEP